MADLLAVLTNGGSSLSAHQVAIATAGHNLQNVNTPGFARQRAELQATLPSDFVGRGQVGRGVSLQAVSQSRDRLIERQMPATLANQSRSSAEADVLEGVAALDPDSASGLTRALGDFYASLRTLSQIPAEPGVRASVAASGRALATTFNRTYDAVEAARNGVDDTLLGIAGEINQAAANVADLNRQIAMARGSGATPNDLLDMRQRNVDKLAELTGATPVINERGEITMMMPNGQALVNGPRSATVAVEPDPGNNGHLRFTINPTDNSGPVATPNTAFGGRVGGLFDARDGALRTTLNDLDQLAYDFSNAFNAVHVNGFGTDGVNNRNFFTPPATVAGAARDLAMDSALMADPGRIAAAAAANTVPGDATNLHLLVGTESTALSGGNAVGKTLGTVLSNYGSSTSQARATADQDGALREHLEGMRESVSGVSIDEELIQLTRSQRAFEAVMKVISTADDMLNTLVNLR